MGERSELLEEIRSVLDQIGIDAAVDNSSLVVDGATLDPRIEERAHPTPAILAQLVKHRPVQLPALVVADRVSDAGRDVLRDAGWGWLDRRGHLRLWGRGVRVETPFAGHPDRPERGGNPWTTVGLEIALCSLCDPTEPVTARRVAAAIGRSVGATHELIGRFTDNGLIGPRTHLPLLPDLFWETAAHWPDDGWTALPLDLIDLAHALDTDELIRVDERAATLGGAQIPAAGDLPARCYAPSTRLLRRARALADRDLPVRSWVRASPVQWIPEMAAHPPDAAHPWRIAHPMLSALRLAADPARGSEIVESWGIVPEESG